MRFIADSSEVNAQLARMDTSSYGVVQSFIGSVPVALSPERWSVVGNERVLHIHFSSTDASALRVSVALARSHPDLSLRFFSRQGERVHVDRVEYKGGDLAEQRRLSSATLPGADAGIELALPLDVSLAQPLALVELAVIHIPQPTPDAPADAALLVNAQCVEPADPLNRSAVLLLMPNATICSGNFVNSTNPQWQNSALIYTAAHCLSDPVSAMNTEIVPNYAFDCGNEWRISYFEYVQVFGPLPSVIGAELLATGLPGFDPADGLIALSETESDFTLLAVDAGRLAPYPYVLLGYNTDAGSGGLAATTSHPLAYAKSHAEVSHTGIQSDFMVIETAPVSGALMPGSSGTALVNDRLQLMGTLSSQGESGVHYFAPLAGAWPTLCPFLSDGVLGCPDVSLSPLQPPEPTPRASDDGGSVAAGVLMLLLLVVYRRRGKRARLGRTQASGTSVQWQGV
ncbi:hypothetical protein KUV89_02100 [Marinobacter hydrocarbonoclasticus]|nr:hypothetical protein [Marinobacter nauticus]